MARAKLSANNQSLWRGENVGIIFQFFQMMPSLTLLNNVMLPMELAGKYPDILQDEVVGEAARSLFADAEQMIGLQLPVLIGGAVLDFIEFPTNAVQGAVPADVIWSLGLFVGPATSIFSLLGVVSFLRYQIDKTRHQQIIRDLEARRLLVHSSEKA